MSTAEVDRRRTTRPARDAIPEPERRRPRLSWRSVLALLVPGLLYLGIRQVGLIVLGWLANRNNVVVGTALTSWDGQWYLGIAANGYPGVPGDLADAFGRRTPATPLAFFPGYPMTVHWVSRLPAVSLTSAALAVSVVSGVLCAYGLHRIGRRVNGGSRPAGLILVALFAASPMAIVLSMTYSEAMFCALAAWALVGVLERKWLLAGLCAAATGLVRPTAAALIVTVVAAALVALIRHRDGWRPWLGILLAPVGLLGYLGFVALRTGSWDGWFALQREGWNSAFDGGTATWNFTLQALSSGRSILEVGTVAVLLTAIGLVAVSVRERLNWPVVLYGALVLAMDLGSNGLMNSKARLLLPAFTLLIPLACALAGKRRSTVLMVLAGWVLATSWFGAYSITVWQYAI